MNYNNKVHFENQNALYFKKRQHLFRLNTSGDLLSLPAHATGNFYFSGANILS